MPGLILIIITAVISIFLGWLIPSVPAQWIVALFVSAAAAALTFFRPGIGLGILVFSMLLSPEIGAGAAGSGRNIVIRYDDILLVVIFFSWLAKSAISKKTALFVTTPVHMPILLYIFVCLISTAFGVFRGEVRLETGFFYVLKYIEYFLIYFMTANIVEKNSDAKRYLIMGIVTAFIVTAYAYWYYYSFLGQAVRVTAPFESPLGQSADPNSGEPATLGGYYLIVFGLLAGFIATVSGKGIFFSVISILLMFPAFLLTLSRASYMGIAVSFISLVALVPKRRIFLLFAATGLIIGLSSVNMLWRPVVNRVLVTFYGGGNMALQEVVIAKNMNVKVEDSASQRIKAWQRILFERLPKHFLLGHGVSGVGLEDTQYGTVLGETGIIGFTFFIWMLYRLHASGKRLFMLAEEPWIKAMALGFLAGFWGLLAQALTTNTFIIVRVMEPFWFLAAMVARLGLEAEKGKDRLKAEG